ncbi:hypothetical protein [Mycobacteroides abscessus]|uniref:hypothetical protein n=1 Tax=Mycobacteroides abscessus TaxID=36809 RepID=UPI000C259E0D|nr:hypothetical protein [Mycobacteroides abscessus]
MAYRQVRISDLTGLELDEKDAVEVTVKGANKKFDASAEELKALKPLTSVVELELKYASGQVSTMLVSQAEFKKTVPDDKLASFDSARGRRSGFSPSAQRNGQTHASAKSE